MRAIDFEIRTHCIFGAGKISVLPETLKNESFGSVAFIVDNSVKDNSDVKGAIEKVQNEGISVSTFINTVAEPDYDFLDDFKAKVAVKSYDCIVGIGGGSTLDLAKGIATLLKNEGPGISYRGFPKLKNRPLPVIAIPTTAGTGSEVTYNAVFTDSKEKKKLGINSKFNYPLYAILDPNLTLSCPLSVTASSGMDAMVHTLESWAAKNATIYSKMFAREAFRLLYSNLMRVVKEPNNIEVRGNILLGAHFAGASLMNSGAGPSGALSYPLGSIYKVPHGIAGAVFIPRIVRFNVEHGYNGYNELYDLIEGVDKNLPEDKKRMEFAKMIELLCDTLNVPKKLTAFGLRNEDGDVVVEKILGQPNATVEQNPIPMKREDAQRIVDGMF